VTFSATVPDGHTIDWYDASGGGSIVSGGSGVTSFSPTLTATTTYYAQARNITVATCVSASRLAVKGTVTAYGTSGSAPGTCGCASELTDCSGTCLASCCTNCASWTTCSGFTQVSNVSYENSTTMNWSTADTFCRAKGTGWRLPTRTELQCMCSSKESLPGGYVGNYYWSSTANDSGYYYIVYFNSSCDTYYDTYSYNRYVKCVN
jgi:hypothetical protein